MNGLKFLNILNGVSLKKNDLYLNAGAYTNKIGFLRKGVLRAFEIIKNGNTITHYFYHLPLSGKIISYEAFSSNTINNLSVEALTDCAIFEIKKR